MKGVRMLLQAILTTKISANTMSFYIAACIYAIYVYKEIIIIMLIE